MATAVNTSAASFGTQTTQSMVDSSRVVTHYTGWTASAGGDDLYTVSATGSLADRTVDSAGQTLSIPAGELMCSRLRPILRVATTVRSAECAVTSRAESGGRRITARRARTERRTLLGSGPGAGGAIGLDSSSVARGGLRARPSFHDVGNYGGNDLISLTYLSLLPIRGRHG